MRHSFLKSSFDPNNYKTYHANCHCGLIRYKADVSPPLEDDHEVVTCNCAMCIRTGAWNVYVPVETVTFTRGEDKLKKYRYLGAFRNFCPNCCVHMTTTLVDQDQQDQKIMSLNVRAFSDIDSDKIKVRWVEMRDAEPEYDVDKMPEPPNENTK